MKKLICILLVCGLLTGILVACGEKENKEDTKSASADSASTQDEAAKEMIETFDIKTSYGTLKYPKKWKDDVDVKIDDSGVYTVSFSYQKTPLFDLTFDGGEGDILGTIPTDKGSTVVRIKSYTPDPKAKNIAELTEMMDNVNVIIDHLEADYDFVKGETATESSNEVFAIETSLAKLYYPKKWEDSVTITKEEKAVRFSSGDVKLFDLLFGGDKGDLLGVYDGTELRIVLHEVKQGKLSTEAYSNLLGMRDDVNVIIEHLTEDKKFKIAE